MATSRDENFIEALELIENKLDIASDSPLPLSGEVQQTITLHLLAQIVTRLESIEKTVERKFGNG